RMLLRSAKGDLPGAVAQPHSEVAGHGLVIEEIAAQLPGLVAERQHELAKAVGAVDAHDVPDDRPPADLDQFFLGQRAAAHARALAAAEDDYRDVFNVHRLFYSSRGEGGK